MIEMAEEKKRSWVTETPDEEIPQEPELTEEQMKEIREFQLAVESAPILMVDLLKSILAELRYANNEAFGGQGTYDDGIVVSETITSAILSVPESQPSASPSLVVPTNIEGEDKIISYYKGRFREVRTRTSNTGLSEEEMEKMSFAFTEHNIILKTPRLETPLFAAFASFVDQMLGGEYIRGAGAHFVLPYP